MKLSNQMDLEKQHFIVVSATSSLVERSWILKQFHVFVKGAISMEQRSEVVAYKGLEELRIFVIQKYFSASISIRS